jgi:hypothetical protein
MFSPMDEEHGLQCQADDDEGDADVEREAEHEHVQLGKDPGENAEHHVGEEQEGEHRRAELDAEHEHVAAQAHERCHRARGEVQRPGRQQLVGLDDHPEEEVVAVQGQEGEQGEDVDELAHQRELLGGLRVEDVGRGEPHLVADDRAAEAHRGEHQLRDQADERAEQHLVDHQEAKGGEGEVHLRGVRGHEREQHQGGGHGQAELHPHRGGHPGKGRNGGHQGDDPGQAEEEGLELGDRDELQVHGGRAGFSGRWWRSVRVCRW